jgi:hypothetical protein
MTMIEKMARAMILAVSPGRDFTMNPYYEVERNYWEHIIRAGLAAMIEPDSAMLTAADKVLYGYEDQRCSGEIVRSAIQAALDEKEG